VCLYVCVCVCGVCVKFFGTTNCKSILWLVSGLDDQRSSFRFLAGT